MRVPSRLANLWPWPAIVLLIVFAVVILAVWSVAAQTEPHQSVAPPNDERADPAGFMEGDLDPKAVATVLNFKEFPVLWLGEEFKGYKLTSTARTSQGGLSMIYGTCDWTSTGHGSCNPPVNVIIWPPESIPGTFGDAPCGTDPGYVDDRRGLLMIEVAESPMLSAAGGLAVQIHSNADIREEIIDSLMLANGAAFGLPEIGAGESLAPIGQFGCVR